MPKRVVLTEPGSDLVIEIVEFDAIGDETFHACELIAIVLGLEPDPEAMLARIESDADFRRSVLSMPPTDLFQGMRNGQLDEIASGMMSRAKDICLAVEARIAAEAALQECT